MAVRRHPRHPPEDDLIPVTHAAPGSPLTSVGQPRGGTLEVRPMAEAPQPTTDTRTDDAQALQAVQRSLDRRGQGGS